MTKKKYNRLFLGLLFDAIGMASYLIPGVAELTDLAWAPIAGWLMTKLYPGKTGVASGILTTIEELVPGLDFIPSFTLTWVYYYLIKSGGTEENEQEIIDV